MYFLFTQESDMDSYKPLKVFIAQSMPIPKTVVLPSGLGPQLLPLSLEG